MLQRTSQSPNDDWLGLTRLAGFLLEREAAAGRRAAPPADEEVIDRLYRMLEIVALVDEHGEALRNLARHSGTHDAMQVAVDLRRLANRLQSVGNFLVDTSHAVLEIEDTLLVELDDRYRQQSLQDYAA